MILRGGYLYKPTSDIQWTPKHSWTSDRPQKQASEKVDQSTFGSVVMIISLLMKLSVGDENHSMPLCVYVAGLGKTSHILSLLTFSVHINEPWAWSQEETHM